MDQDMKRMEGRAKDGASLIKDTIEQTAASAEHLAKRTGEAVESTVDQIREQVSDGSTADKAMDAAVRKTKETSAYFREQGIGGVVEDLETLIRRYPLQALLVGLGCGYLLSRARTD